MTMTSDTEGAEMSSEPFGFTVEIEEHWKTGEAGWRVSLPHQCDSWDISTDVEEPVAHAVAVERLEAFLAEGAAALAALREGREVHPW